MAVTTTVITYKGAVHKGRPQRGGVVWGECGRPQNFEDFPQNTIHNINLDKNC